MQKTHQSKGFIPIVIIIIAVVIIAGGGLYLYSHSVSRGSTNSVPQQQASTSPGSGTQQSGTSPSGYQSSSQTGSSGSINRVQGQTGTTVHAGTTITSTTTVSGTVTVSPKTTPPPSSVTVPGIAVQSTPSAQVSNGKTFYDPDNAFKLKYPSGWRLEAYTWQPQENTRNGSGVIYFISTHVDDVDVAYKTYLNLGSNSNSGVKAEQPVTIGGSKGVVFLMENAGQQTYFYVVFNGSTKYTFVIVNTPALSTTDMRTFDQIMATLTF